MKVYSVDRSDGGTREDRGCKSKKRNGKRTLNEVAERMTERGRWRTGWKGRRVRGRRGQKGKQKRARLHEESPVQEERAERGSYK